MIVESKAEKQLREKTAVTEKKEKPKKEKKLKKQEIRKKKKANINTQGSSDISMSELSVEEWGRNSDPNWMVMDIAPHKGMKITPQPAVKKERVSLKPKKEP